MDIFELLKAILFGIVEGITEWLPVSSTGHLILLNQFVELKVFTDPEQNKAFMDMFNVVIQLAAIFAVILLFFNKLNPLSTKKTVDERKSIWNLWFKVVIAVFPSAVLGIPLDGWIEDNITGIAKATVVAVALIVYGVAFLFIEKKNEHRELKIKDVYDIDYRTAIFIGIFQCLSIIPGTSRSGSTILGAILLGISRSAGAEFSFFLAIPTMLGASALKLLDFLRGGISMTATAVGVLVVACIVSFVVSLLVIKGLMEFVRKRSFSGFGYYRIVLGILVLGYFAITALI